VLNDGRQGAGRIYPQDRAVRSHDPVVDQWHCKVSGRSPWNILGAVCLWVQLRRLAGRFLRWSDAMIGRPVLWIGWATVIVLIFQTAPLSRIAYAPQTVTIVGEQVALIRSFPLDALGMPRPWLSYIETVRPLTQSHNGGHPCADRGGPFQYGNAEPVRTWSIAWASDCLNDPTGYRWSAQWFWHLGRVKLGPVNIVHTVLHPIPTD